MESSGSMVPFQSTYMPELAFRSILHPSDFLNLVYRVIFIHSYWSFHVRLVGPVCGRLSTTRQIKRCVRSLDDRSYFFVFTDPASGVGAELLAEPEHCAASDIDCQSTGNAVGICQICILRLPTEMIESALRMVLCVK